MRLKSPTVAPADGTSSIPTSNPCKGKNPTTSNAKKTSCLRPLLWHLSLLPLLLANEIPPAAAAASASSKEHRQVHVQESRGQEATASVPVDVDNTGTSRESGPLRRKRRRRRQRQAREVDRKVSRSEHFRKHSTSRRTVKSSDDDDNRNDDDGDKTAVNYAQVQAPTADAESKVQIAKLHFYMHASENAAQKEPSASVHIDEDGHYNHAQYADETHGMNAVVDQKQERPEKTAKLQFYPMQQHPQPKQPSDGHVAHMTFYQLDTADHTSTGTNRGYAKTDANVGSPKRGGAKGAKERGEGLLAWIAKQQQHEHHEQNADAAPTMLVPISTMMPTAAPIPKPTSLQPTLGPTHGPVVSTVTNSPLSHSTALDGEPQNKMGDVPAHDVGAGEGSTEAESEASLIANSPTASPSSHRPTILTTPPSALPTTESSFHVAAPATSPETEISQSSASYYYTSVSYSYSYSYEYYSYSMSMEYGGGARGAGGNSIDDRYGNGHGPRREKEKQNVAQSSSYQHAQRKLRPLRDQRLRQQRQRQRRRGMSNLLRARDNTT